MSKSLPPGLSWPRALRGVILGLLITGGAMATLPGVWSPAVAAPEPAQVEPALPLRVADAELRRIMSSLQGKPDAPYYASYGIVETTMVRIGASNGALGVSSTGRAREADVDVRVGTPELDNTHKIRDASWFESDRRANVSMPIEDDERVIREQLWQATDDAWRDARRRLTKVLGNEAVKVERADGSPDFSPAPAERDIQAPVPLNVDVAAWEGITREVSKVFLEYPEVTDSVVSLTAESELRMFTSSEGTLLQQARTRYRVSVMAFGVAEDGMELEVYDYADAASMDGLPGRAQLLSMARAAAKRVVDLRNAPLLEPFTGPAILRGRAAGVFFHEVFGHRAEGHRQKDEDEGQTFTSKVGELILPDFLSVTDDPNVVQVNKIDLNGHYRYDDEGVRAQRVELIVGGVLKNFLLSRAPIKGFPLSNGHGRRQAGNAVVARQGNLMVEAKKTMSFEALRAKLLDEVRRQGRPFGLIVDDITGGFTLTGRVIPNSFNVRPVTIWRVYTDGRPDQLVRGGDLIGTPLNTFSRILAAGDDVDVFNGVCGAESGWVPVSATSPSLLLSEIEVQRKEKGNDRPPLLTPPGAPPATVDGAL
ncbi:MAG: TldD/PmbA family protein [Deltaproteobacteria bacterium]|nr:TldD/PmbA family protein [Deltaproteobacteria bacterium]